jgi:tryptophan-rich sensory protein
MVFLLEKPSFNPPNWIFGPAWTILYLLMGISIYLVWQRVKENKNNKKVMFIFWIHLFLNTIWSIIFFGFQNVGLAFINIVVIWFFIVLLMILFWKIDRRATYLLIPYLLWVSFASILNLSILLLN